MMPEPTPPLPAPTRIEWRGPGGWTVWADEDGVHIRVAGERTALEEVEVRQLVDVWTAACAAFHRPHSSCSFPALPDLPF